MDRLGNAGDRIRRRQPGTDQKERTVLIKATQSLLASLVLLAASAAQATAPVRIDGTTDESVQLSIER